jgi:hypothetical protein
VWVSDGCAGAFALGNVSGTQTTTPGNPQQSIPQASPVAPPEQVPIETWGALEPGKGFLVGKSKVGELSIGAYALVRYINQLPVTQSFTDHLGNEHDIDTRNDIYSHRIMVFLKGWMGVPKHRYVIFLWTVNTTDQKAIFDNLSGLGITAKQLTRDMATRTSIWWMPTTQEFGPQGAFGDWEKHDKLATRIGISTTRSREDRFSNVATGAPDNTTMRLADSLNLFDPGSLAPGVTVQLANYRLLSIDAGMKYRGFFLQTEIYTRWLDGFRADGPLPVRSILDKGFYVQGSFYPITKKLEVYGATSQTSGMMMRGSIRATSTLVASTITWLIHAITV